jgi:hypothetical protein
LAKTNIAQLDRVKGDKPALLLVDDDPLIAEPLALVLEEDFQVGYCC